MEQIRTLTPRTAVIWSVLRAELDRRAGERLSVLDVGGGTGGFAVPLAEAGHRVTVVDASPDALAALTRRAAEAGVADRVRATQGDADALTGLVEPATVDLVLCHSVLEVVDDPEPVMSALVTALRPDGAASVLVAGRAAAVFGRAMNGQLDAAAALAADPHGTTGGRDTLRRRYDAADASALLTAAGLVVEEIHGVRVLADLLPAAVADGQQAALVELERALAARSPYRDLAAQLHLFARRPA
ncbi:methyltransferase domain-containing protein [Micromonospora aurantiaca]|uniref:Methyltransferase domain-containing protein n=2 Tax=Micromonospora aurantiaca (nom. illeg.) TaxID=47850 RepID=A0A1C6TLP7_9ACTN|nr:MULTISPECIES: methyltransferase domain-containing protein [Micromonospora]ADU09322.1 Methyltransferase type 12 [Micromonospora sp. L5]AXH94060.1 methyltransferase domain-containing protein [Micromonospora aurantiaca]KAB1103148.1 methyltransferase domain-containing protein [Micromonospora aurantiaca]MBC9006455.1 methyltransferase domain-containing protein [Micromonospora aurantiaca]OHX06546.1 methyltransferase type 12 [Micromonospora sp. WMMB235]